MRAIVMAAAALIAAGSAAAQPTWSREDSRIARGKCQICHRPNDIAPFSLMTWEDAKNRAERIEHVVRERIMPPWKPVAGHGRFRDSYALTDEERQTIVDWIAAGAPEGDPADLPESPAQSGEWQLGEPDKIVQMPAPWEIPRQKDVYRCFVIDPQFDEDKHVSAIEVLPGNRQVVHHVILFIDATGQAEKLDEKEEGPGYTCFGGPGIDVSSSILAALSGDVGGLGGWVPGMRAARLPEKVGIYVPKRAKLIMQVHYFPGGRPDATDQTRVGIYYAKEKIEKRLRYLPVLNTSFRIPPGEERAEVTAQMPVFPFLEMHAIQIAPHMHLLGREIKVERIDLRGESESMIYINDWDFHWQGFYTYEEPVPLRMGDRVKLTCIFDNSERNHHNPSSPPKAVGWGEGTEDEMCLVFLGVTFDRESL